MTCKICSGCLQEFSIGKVLSKYDVRYFRCDSCGFIQTENPYWLSEAYLNPINRSDTGLLSRNIYLSKVVRHVLGLFRFPEGAKFLDYGGGYGIFVRLMRDAGKSFYWWDPHCQNLFAQGLEHHDGDGPYELLTAFEVLEHSVDPLRDMEKMFSLTSNVLLTTELLPRHCPRPGEWWYYGLDHGQHVSFFSEKALRVAAEKFDCRLYSHRGFHMMTRKRIVKPLFDWTCILSKYF